MREKKRIFQIEIVVALLLIALLWVGAAFKLENIKTQAQRNISIRNRVRLMDAIAVYRGDNKGRCPDNLEDLLKEHADKIHEAYDRHGNKSNAVKNGAYSKVFDGSGGWIYINDPADPKYCTVEHNVL
ncbi:MAG: hypothetical protein LBG16_01860 [Elusimicrobiota bacterium]|jgi:type II secretory pathway pseudopilin PulG|nr:hypothetical protein [Elusimicrobiota bacterium]